MIYSTLQADFVGYIVFTSLSKLGQNLPRCFIILSVNAKTIDIDALIFVFNFELVFKGFLCEIYLYWFSISNK
jgi:hypothetical protein